MHIYTHISLPPPHNSDLSFLRIWFFAIYCFPKMVCRNICERLKGKPSFEYNQYIDGKKYCRRCEIFLYYNGIFCPCCGMQLRRTPSNKSGKERLKKRNKKSIILTTRYNGDMMIWQYKAAYSSITIDLKTNLLSHPCFPLNLAHSCCQSHKLIW